MKELLIEKLQELIIAAQSGKLGMPTVEGLQLIGALHVLLETINETRQ
jgi:hypothetical protein